MVCYICVWGVMGKGLPLFTKPIEKGKGMWPYPPNTLRPIFSQYIFWFGRLSSSKFKGNMCRLQMQCFVFQQLTFFQFIRSWFSLYIQFQLPSITSLFTTQSLPFLFPPSYPKTKIKTSLSFSLSIVLISTP